MISLSSSSGRALFVSALFALVFGALMIGTLFSAQPVQADSPTPTPVITDDMVNAIASQLYCPVCENIPLDVCGTQACAQWRELIRQKLQQGWTEDQIKAYFVQRYGERVLATPRPQGFGLLVYILPPAAILLGIFILLRALRNWRATSHFEAEAKAEPKDTEEEDAYLRAVEEALKKSD